MSVSAAWEQVRENLRRQAGKSTYDRWLSPITLLDDSDRESVRLGLPTAFMASWVRNHYAERLLLEFRMLVPGIRVVTVETAAQPAAVLVANAPAGPAATPALAAEPAPFELDRPEFDTRYSFDSFVVHPSNRVACNAARAQAAPGPTPFVPLFIYGGTGQGKTHLLQSAGRAFLEAHPRATAVYMSGERFMFEFVQALRNGDTFAFKARLRSVDLLMLDDLQFIAGKNSTQEECFHLVDEFMDRQKRLIIAADRCPQALDGLDARLTSRLSAGLVADIKAPDLDLRRAILDRRNALLETPVSDEVLDLIASRITSNIRELEGAFNRLIAYASLSHEAVSYDFAMRTLAELFSNSQRRVTIDEIQRAVSSHFEVKQLDMVSARRERAIARPRQVAMYIAKQLTTRSLPEIGRKFGNRDHTTVIHAVRRIEELRQKDQEIDGAVRALIHRLQA